MKKDNIVYMKSPDGLTQYRANLTKGVVLKISRNKKTQLDFSLWSDIKSKGLVKSKKDEWRIAENNYYVNNDFEWMYDGKRYMTVDTPFSQRQLQEIKDGSVESYIYLGYQYLAFHNGQVWGTYIGGNYYPRMPLVRRNIKGEMEYKWTHVKYLRNFIKCR